MSTSRITSSPTYAHSENDAGNPHDLRTHLEIVAQLARKFAGQFAAGDFAYYAGLWHDLGKYSHDFQQYIRAVSSDANDSASKSRVDHSTAGAIFAEQSLGPIGRILAYQIAGHHAGLADWQSEASGNSGLAQRIQNSALLEKALASCPPEEILQPDVALEKPRPGLDPALFIRMLFSCLVDADFLDTEAFFDSQKADMRPHYPSIPALLSSFNEHMSAMQADAEKTPVNVLRTEVSMDCVEAAARPPGIFTLTVPTGGGKTLSSMAFAINHAVKYDKRRIIYVIPYTSIIEQTADIFRGIFGEAVIEHHSNFDPQAGTSEHETSEAEETTKAMQSRLAAENWDAPIIVTTTVQFFESLFAARKSRCRKLHNIVNSVVVLDEAQLLPPEFLNPILAALKELRMNYGVTILLSTATQQALGERKSFDFTFLGLDQTTEIVKRPLQLHERLRRTALEVPTDLTTPSTWEDIASELNQHPSVLCIVNRRDDCRILHQLMPEGTIHLSALMCGAHRSAVIEDIKVRLKAGTPTRVISTQLVEAGVDVDFPVVYRALAGLDSIAQAAGRCNREGRLACGQVVVFVPPSEVPRGHLRQAAEIGRQLLTEGADDPLSPERFEEFFRQLYWLKGAGLDKHGILQLLAPGPCLSFRSAAEKFHLIDESLQAPVIVNYGESPALIGLLAKKGPERWLMRKLQRYVVNLPRYLHKKLLADIQIKEIAPGIFIQNQAGLYDDALGFFTDKSGIYEPDQLIC